MTGIKFEKGSKEFAFFAEFWKMVQKYYIPEDTDSYWDELIAEAAQLKKKYDGRFYHYMIQGFMNYAEEVNRDNE